MLRSLLANSRDAEVIVAKPSLNIIQPKRNLKTCFNFEASLINLLRSTHAFRKSKGIASCSRLVSVFDGLGSKGSSDKGEDAPAATGCAYRYPKGSGRSLEHFKRYQA